MIITQTPLRVSLFGGATDYPWFFADHGAVVLSMTIDKYIFVIARERYDTWTRAGYSRTEFVEDVSELDHDLIREAIRQSGFDYDTKGIEVNTMADIPSSGSGLGSSAAVTVGALLACSALADKPMTGRALAENAYDIEALLLERPVGYQDQYAVATGGLRAYTFTAQGIRAGQTFEPVVSGLNKALLLFNTGTTRSSTKILSRQLANISQNEHTLLKMKEIAQEAVKVLTSEADIRRIGHLLNDTWELKKTLADGISNIFLDTVYQTALDEGALGGKLCGAGAGGYLLLYVPTIGARARVRGYMRSVAWPELPFKIEPSGSKIILDYRRPA